MVNAILAQQGSDFYHLQFALTSLTGVMLAGMAKRNELDNIYNVMDVESGYPMMMRGFANPGWIDRNLGTEYLFDDLLLKHWPANMWIQTPLDCLDQLKREHNFTADDIEEIFVSPTYMERVKFSWDGYASCRDAQFSIPYCLAAYMLRGDPGPGWYDSSRLNDKELLNLASKVKSDPDKVQNLWVAFNMFQNGSFPTTTMRITLKGGKQVEITLPFPKGHAKNPFAILKQIKRCVQEQPDTLLARQTRLLEAIPGAGLLTAVTIVCEIGDFRAFHRPKQLYVLF